MTWLPGSPGSTLVLRLNQEIVHDFILLFLPPCGPHLTPLATGSLEPSLLVFSTPGASPATTFRACSSPAPTPVKSQPTPTILSQESVHTTLSITHHTRKWPSTGLRTTHGPQSPSWWVHWQHTHLIIKKKRKKNRNDQRNSNKRSKAEHRQRELERRKTRSP
jgi:hypothetical protein